MWVCKRGYREKETYFAEKVSRWARIIMAAWRRTSSLSFSSRCSKDSFMNTYKIHLNLEKSEDFFKHLSNKEEGSLGSLTLVFPNCHSFFVLSYLNNKSVVLFLSSPAVGTLSFRMILYLSHRKQKSVKLQDRQQRGNVLMCSPWEEIFESSANGKASSTDLHRLQHPRISQLV